MTWPADPLVRLIHARPESVNADMAKVFDVTPRTAWVWRRQGLGDAAADRCAHLLGLHPCNVWPDWISEGAGTHAA
jgi:hypothetical protein